MADSNLGLWAQARLPASWRGLPFRVRESQTRRGRRGAVHEYPFRDTVWVEDLGRATRVVQLRGFIAGDDVDGQLQALDAAVETAGTGTLVHPVLGSIADVSCTSFTSSETWEEGRVFVLEFEFVLGSPRSYPSAAANTQGAVAGAAPALTGAAGASFGGQVGSFLSEGISIASSGTAQVQNVVAGVESTVGGYVTQAMGLVNSVSVIGNAATGLTGSFGRFSLGARLTAIPGLTNVTQALGAASASAAAAQRIGATVQNLASRL